MTTEKQITNGRSPDDGAEPILIKFVRTSCFTRWHCDVCGGDTEKDAVLCEGKFTLPNGRVDDVLVCPQCLDRDIDARLKETARQLESHAAWTRLLIGRLRVPTYAQWEQEMDRTQALWEETIRTSDYTPLEAPCTNPHLSED
jgi:hypothetical protein